MLAKSETASSIDRTSDGAMWLMLRIVAPGRV